jgi:hypothetical protein
LIGAGPEAYMKGRGMLAFLILAALVTTIRPVVAVRGVGALHRLPKRSRLREAPALRSRRPKERDLPDMLLQDGSGIQRSGDRMRLWS